MIVVRRTSTAFTLRQVRGFASGRTLNATMIAPEPTQQTSFSVTGQCWHE